MPIWTGAIAFGLVAIPIKLTSATSSHDIALHQYHAADGGRIRYWKVCELEEEPVEPDEIVKGVETDAEIVLLDDDDLADLPVSTSKTIEVVEFVPASEIDPILYEKAYYLEPDKAAGIRPYVLLREALVEKDRIAIVKITLRRRESLAALRPRGQTLMLHTMLWPDEIRTAQTAGLDAEARRQELDLAGTLIDAMSKDAFDPEQYSDDYQEALRAAIDAKAHGRPIAKAGKVAPRAGVFDLMDALAKSVDQAGSGKRAAKKTARKATAKQTEKQTARKSAAKKTAKQAPARKQRSA